MDRRTAEDRRPPSASTRRKRSGLKNRGGHWSAPLPGVAHIKAFTNSRELGRFGKLLQINDAAEASRVAELSSADERLLSFSPCLLHLFPALPASYRY